MGAPHFLKTCLLAAAAHGYVISSPDGPLDDGVGRRTSAGHTAIHWPSAGPVPLRSEISLLASGTLVRRGEFGHLAGSRALEVALACDEQGLSFRQGASIRKQLLWGKLMRRGGMRKLRRAGSVRALTRQFEAGQTPLLELAARHDLPPVSILRAILTARVRATTPRRSRGPGGRRPAGTRRVVQAIIGETSDEHVARFLSDWELAELRTAKAHDAVGHRPAAATAAADAWERAVYAYLDAQGVRYLSEEDLKRGGAHGGWDAASRGTPDCVILNDDELVLNGRAVRWIEFKSYYASGLRDNAPFTRRAVSRQVERYQREFGPRGAVILRDGFSDEVSRRYPDTLFLDGGPLVSRDPFSRPWGDGDAGACRGSEVDLSKARHHVEGMQPWNVTAFEWTSGARK